VYELQEQTLVDRDNEVLDEVQMVVNGVELARFEMFQVGRGQLVIVQRVRC